MAKKPAKKKQLAKKPAGKAAKKAAAKKPAAKVKAKAPKASHKADDGKVGKTRTAQKPKNTSTLSYTQSEFLENLRAFCGLTKRSQAKELSEDIAAFILDALKRGYKIPLLGLGKMYVRQTKARTGRNPATGQEIHIPAKKRVRFTAAKALKDVVLK